MDSIDAELAEMFGDYVPGQGAVPYTTTIAREFVRNVKWNRLTQAWPIRIDYDQCMRDAVGWTVWINSARLRDSGRALATELAMGDL